MNDRLGFAAIILLISLAMILQKVDWQWQVEWPPEPPLRCAEIVLPPPPLHQGWLRKAVKPKTQPASVFLGAEADLYLVTAYAVEDGLTPGIITADGRKVRPGITAACPEELTLGTMVYIEDIGARVCEDRGSAIVGKRLDVAFGSPEAALLFGKRWMRVAVIR